MRSQSDLSQEEAKSKAEELSKLLAEGGDFIALASEHSFCPSKKKGGDLGTFGRRQMTPKFEKAAFDLEVGATSGVVETPFGYHIIQRYR